MPGLKAILLTLAVVFAALATAAVVLTVVWLLGNLGTERLINIVGTLTSIVALVFAIFVYARRHN